MEFVVESFQADWEAFLRFAPRLCYAALVLAVALLLAKLAGRATATTLQRTDRFKANHRFLRLLVTGLIGSAGLLLTLGVLGLQGVATSLLATGGAVAIVLGFAFREIGENVLAGFFLSFSRPFELGDLITTGGITGVVRTIELRHIHVRTADGCDVYIPSAQMFREALHNYTRDGLRRPSFSVGVAYQESPQRVMALLKEAANGPSVLTQPGPTVTIKEFASQYVIYEVSFWLDVLGSDRGLPALRNEVMVQCWQALADAGVALSSDVSSAIELTQTPPVRIELVNAPANQD